MKIINDWPSNIEEIKKLFPVHEGVVITIGDTIYNPGKNVLSEHLIIHETVHSEQQKKHKSFNEFFKLYANDPKFRLRMEVEAYGTQIKFIKKKYGVEKTMLALHHFALELSGPLYGNIVDYTEARELIRKQSYYK